MLVSAYTTISHFLFLFQGPAHGVDGILSRLTTGWTTLAFGSVFALASLMWIAYYTSADDYRDRLHNGSKTESILSKGRHDSDDDAGEVRWVARLLVCIFALLTLETDLAYLYVQWLRLMWSIIMGARDGSLWMSLVCAATFAVSVVGISIFAGNTAWFFLASLSHVVGIGEEAGFESLKRSFRPRSMLVEKGETDQEGGGEDEERNSEAGRPIEDS